MDYNVHVIEAGDWNMLLFPVGLCECVCVCVCVCVSVCVCSIVLHTE